MIVALMVILLSVNYNECLATVHFLENLKGVLDYYIETRLRNHNIKLIRLKHRMGLIRARLQGAREAQGDVLIFLGECLLYCVCINY